MRWREQAKAFENMAAYGGDTVIFRGSGEPERLEAGLVSADLFATLGVAPAIGRAFTPEDDTVAGAPVVILSNGLWRRRFGSDPQVIGRAITIGDHSRTVVGIMPPGFRFPGDSDLWLPLALNVTGREEDEGPGLLPDVNETIARQFFPNEDPIGHRLLLDRAAPTIVGVAGDTRHSAFDRRVRYEVYLPFLQHSNFELSHLTLAVRGASDQYNSEGMASMASLADAIRNQAQAIDPNEPVYRVFKMDEHIGKQKGQKRENFRLFCPFFSFLPFLFPP